VNELAEGLPPVGEPTVSASIRELYFQLGMALSAGGRFDEALSVLRKALEEAGEEPAGWEIHFWAGRTRERAGDRGAVALHEYLSALRLNPSRLSLILPYAHALLTGDTVAAEREALDAIARWMDWKDLPEEDCALVALLAGRVRLIGREYADARGLFDRGLELAPDDTRLAEGKGESLWRLGELDDAMAAFERGRQLAREGRHRERLVPIESKMAGVMVAQRRHADALMAISEILARDDRYAYELEVNRAQCHLALGRPKLALEAASMASKRRPTAVEPLVLRAQALMVTGQHRGAVVTMDEAIRYAPASAEVQRTRIQAMIEGQIDLDQALRLLARQLAASDPAAASAAASPWLGPRDGNGPWHFFCAHQRRLNGDLEGAVQEVDRALEAGLVSAMYSRYPDIPAHQLRGRLLRSLDRPQQAAESFLEAGRRLGWEDQHAAAVAELKRAALANAELQAAYWYWADAYFALSWSADPPFVHPKCVGKALDRWRRGRALGPPAAAYSWAYLTHALCLERITALAEIPELHDVAGLDPVRRHRLSLMLEGRDVHDEESLLWEALADAERSLLLDDTKVLAWTSLARFSRDLGLYGNAVLATDRAMGLSTEVDQLSERASTLVTVGHAGALDAVDAYRDAQPDDAWGDMLRGYELAARGEFTEALLALDRAVGRDGNRLQFLFHRARTRLLAGMTEEGLDDYQRIWEVTGSARTEDDRTFRAWAAYGLSRYEEAIRLLKALDRTPSRRSVDSWMYLTLAQTALGRDKQALASLGGALGKLATVRQTQDARQDIAELRARLAREEAPDERVALLNDVERRVDKAAASIDPTFTIDRALLEFDRRPPGDSMSVFRAMAVALGKARLLTDAGRWEDAVAIYFEFSQRSGDRPPVGEAVAGLTRAADALMRSSEGWASVGSLIEAVKDLDRAEKLLSTWEDGDGLRWFQVLARRGFAHLLNDRPDAAGTDIAAALRLALSGDGDAWDGPAPTVLLAEAATAMLGGASSYLSLEDRWEELAARLGESGEADALRDAAAATRAELGLRLDAILGLTPDPSALDMPIVTPIVVEVGDGLVPIVDSRQDGGVFLDELIPAMRERILRSTGINVPGLRMRGNPTLPPGGYTVQVDEVSVLTRSVVLGGSFAMLPVGDGAPQPGEELTDIHPLSGEQGLWVLGEVTDDLHDGAEALTTAQYLIHQIELVIRAHLVRFLGPQEVAMLVDTWSEQDDGGLVASVLPDVDARLRLTWVLQALADDGVPITDWRALLMAVRKAGGITAHLRTLHRAARARLHDQLPGPRTGKRPVPVPAELQSTLLGHPPSRPATASWSEPRHEFLRWLRRTLSASGPAITLVASTQEARELVSVLARTEDRLITTLSEDELTPA
jgi:tetratricopeptide (TPR) repeat protein